MISANDSQEEKRKSVRNESDGSLKSSWVAESVAAHKTKSGRAIHRRMMKTVIDWSLIQENDKILVAISGGKDSFALFDLLYNATLRAPFHFEIIGVHLDQVQPGYDPKEFYTWLNNFPAPHQIIQQDTYSVVKEKTRPGQAYCVICSRLRRGILYDIAEELGCNKLAFGHHRDDAIETMFLNMFYAGKIQAMPAIYTTDDGRFQVIRPLIEVGEDRIREFAKERAYPIIPCNLCGSQEGLKREEMKARLQKWEEEIPNLRSVLLNAMKNVRPTHMLDPTLTSSRPRAEKRELRSNTSSLKVIQSS